MSRTNPELQARLEAKARAVISELLAHQKDPAQRTLTDIEQAVRVAGQALTQALTAELVAESAAQVEVEWPTCQACGRRMKAKGKRPKRLVTETGEVSVEREYYHCAACGTGVFSPG
jgi:tRNA(Ile2) C34 agmatinyltransferase TiaS